MRRLLRTVGRALARLVPARYSGRRDRLSAEADQDATTYQFRSGM